MNYTDILYEQLANDYCCHVEDIADGRNHFTKHQFLEGRRTYLEQEECFLKIAVINGKLIFSGREDILLWCEEQYHDTGGEWFFEVKNLHRLNERLSADGYRIAFAHPFYLPYNTDELPNDTFDISWYEADEIEQFRDDNRYKNAYSFCSTAPDIIGVSASLGGNIVGMAGASRDSSTMWQIGIDTDRSMRQHGVGKLLVSMLKNEILRRDILPFYGTGFSHIGSQKVALGAGFMPVWAELVTRRAGMQ